MRVLVTGADGFVGQHLAEALLGRGDEVLGAIHGAEPQAGTLPAAAVARVDWTTFDLRDAASVEALVEGSAPDAVVHLAGVSSVSASWRDPETTFDVNATGALRLMAALRKLPPGRRRRPVLLVSSGEVYGADGTEGAPLTESLSLRPVTPYGASKAAQEMLASVLADHDTVRLIHARSFQQIGPGQQPTFVAADWARQLLEIRDGARPAVLRVGNLEIERDFLDVRDGAAAYLALLDSDEAVGYFNVCSGRSCSLRRLLERLQHAVGISAEIMVDPARLRPAEIRSLIGSPARLIRATGWSPRFALEESLHDLVAHLDTAPRPA